VSPLIKRGGDTWCVSKTKIKKKLCQQSFFVKKIIHCDVRQCKALDRRMAAF
jgi:hypothetical protein